MANEPLDINGKNKTTVLVNTSTSFIVFNRSNHRLYYSEPSSDANVNAWIDPSESTAFDTDMEFWHQWILDDKTIRHYVKRD